MVLSWRQLTTLLLIAGIFFVIGFALAHRCLYGTAELVDVDHGSALKFLASSSYGWFDGDMHATGGDNREKKK